MTLCEKEFKPFNPFKPWVDLTNDERDSWFKLTQFIHNSMKDGNKAYDCIKSLNGEKMYTYFKLICQCCCPSDNGKMKSWELSDFKTKYVWNCLANEVKNDYL